MHKNDTDFKSNLLRLYYLKRLTWKFFLQILCSVPLQQIHILN